MRRYAAIVVISQDIALSFMAVGFLALGWSRRRCFWLGSGGAFLGVVAIEIVRFGVRGGLVAGPISGAWTLGAVLVGCLAWMEALGRPRRLAVMLGVGLRSGALVFDNRLITIYAKSAEALNGFQIDVARRAEATTTCEVQAREYRRLRPPDQAWGHLRNDLADDLDAWADLLRTDAPPDRLEDQRRAFRLLFDRWMHMREAAAQAQRSLATPARRRRRQFVWLVTLGFSTLLVGLAQARGSNVVGLGMAAPNLISDVVTLALGVVFSIAAVVVALRH